MIVEILETYPNSEGWVKGDIVDVTNPEELIKQGLVKKSEPKKSKKK